MPPMRVFKTVIVPYSAQAMYALVDDIEAYPEFLSWCTGASVKRDGNQITATLNVGYGNIHTSFTTRNTHTPSSRIVMSLEGGALSSLAGEWDFHAIDAHSCRVELDLRYAFSNFAVEALFKRLFSYAFGRFCDDFVSRAKAVYDNAGDMEIKLVRCDNGENTPQHFRVPQQSRVADVLAIAGIASESVKTVGIYGKPCSQDTPLRAGDRLEIYLPLQSDPRTRRRQRTRKP